MLRRKTAARITLVLAAIALLVLLFQPQDESVTPRGRRAAGPVAEVRFVADPDMSHTSQRPVASDRPADIVSDAPEGGARSWGSTLVTGVVLAPSGTPVAHATVRCIPGSFAPSIADRKAFLGATTNERGSFDIWVPEAPSYKLLVGAKEGFAKVDISLESINTGALVEVHLGSLSYERLAFIDSAGNPVSIRAYGLKITLPDAIYSSDEICPSAEGRELAEAVGVAQDAAAHRFVALYAVPPGSTSTSVVNVPGYQSIEVDRRTEPLDDWPRETRLVLQVQRARAAGREYLVVFPEFWIPESWTTESVPLFVDVGVGLRQVTPEKNRLIVEAPPRHVLLGDAQVELSFTTDETPERITLRPKAPDLAYATIDFRGPQTEHRGQAPMCMIQQIGEGLSAPARRVPVVAPGRACWGPTAPGRYRLFLGFTNGSVEPSWTIKEIDLSAGHAIVTLE